MSKADKNSLLLNWRKALRGELEPKKAAQVFLRLGRLKFDALEVSEALSFLKKAQGIEPLGLDDQIKLGKCWLLLGRASEAVKILEPLKKSAKGPLAQAYREAGKPEKALDVLDKNSSDPAEIMEIGLALEASGRDKEAQGYFDDIRFGHPGYFDELFETADRFIAQDFAEGVRKTLAKMERIAPADADLLFKMGVRYFVMNMAAEAEAIFRKAISCQPLPQIYRELAGLYERSNQTEKALSFIANARNQVPDDPRISLKHAKILARRGSFEDALEILQGISLDEFDGHLWGEIYSEQAKVLDKLGRYQEAYRAFVESKEALRKTDEFKKLDLSVPYHNAGAFNEKDLGALPKFKPGREEIKGPKQLVFFMGFPRSGTTLIQSILDCHPNIKTVDEKRLFAPVIKFLKDLPAGYPLEIENLGRGEVNHFRELYFLETLKLADFGKATILVDKLPLHTLHVPLIKTIFPESKILFAQRHPFAAAWSCMVQNFSLNNSMGNLLSLKDIARFYDLNMSFWQKTSREIGFDYHLIRYENLIADLETEARAVCRYLGIEFSNDMLGFAARAREKGLISTPSYSQVVKPIYKSALDHWKHYREFFGESGKTLEKWCRTFGYQVD